jgi:hypothetical protein
MAGDEHGAVHFVVECDLAITAPSRHDLDEMNFQAASTLTLTALGYEAVLQAHGVSNTTATTHASYGAKRWFWKRKGAPPS